LFLGNTTKKEKCIWLWFFFPFTNVSFCFDETYCHHAVIIQYIRHQQWKRNFALMFFLCIYLFIF
jgi:hypothetical protein